MENQSVFYCRFLLISSFPFQTKISTTPNDIPAALISTHQESESETSDKASISDLIGSNISDLIQDTFPSVLSAGPAPDLVQNCGDFTSGDLTSTRVNEPTMNSMKEDTVSLIPISGENDVMHHESISSCSLLDKLTPESFTMDLLEDRNKKRKTKKADFFKDSSTSIAPTNDANDPFGDLDPMWVMKS